MGWNTTSTHEFASFFFPEYRNDGNDTYFKLSKPENKGSKFMCQVLE